MNTLIAYFSATGNTKEVAERIQTVVGGDLFEITPKEKYTKEDLDWRNPNSRSSIEMNDINSRPEILNKVEDIENYQKVIIGFPVWWYIAPRIIYTFIEENNLENKEIYIYVTSGSSSETKSFEDLKEKYPNLNFVKVKRFTGSESAEEYKSLKD